MAMEPPTALAPRAISEEKNKVFRSMRPIDPAEVVRGQYEGYRARAGRRARLRDRDVRRAALRDRQLALGRACRSTCAPASGWPRARGSSRSPSASRRRACSRPARASAQYGPDHLTFDLDESSRLSLSFYGKRPGPGMRLDKLSMQFSLERDRPRRRRARGLRAADPRRDERRPHAVHDRRRASSGCGRSRRRCSTTRRRCAPTRPASWGPDAIQAADRAARLAAAVRAPLARIEMAARAAGRARGASRPRRA